MFILLAALGVAAPATTLGIFDLSASGAEAGLKATAIDSLAAAIGALPGFKVVTRTEIEAMLGADKVKQTLGCTDVSCLAEIGAAVGVSRVVAGSLANVDGAYVVNLQLINTQYANVENRASLTWRGSGAFLADLMGAAAELLVLNARDKKPGQLKVSGQPVEAVLVVDGEQKALIGALPIGIHELRVDAPGYESQKLPFIVRNDRTTQLDIQLQRVAEAPVYKKWWFWTIIGSAVAGGAATTAYFLTRPGGINGSPKQGIDLSVPNPGAAR